MLIDARTLPEQTTFEHDICIIGAGAAGITLALEFSNQPLQVCLYIAGSSVFPTGGISNPTLTIVALAARLADRIKAQMSSRAEVIKLDAVAQLEIDTPPVTQAS